MTKWEPGSELWLSEVPARLRIVTSRAESLRLLDELMEQSVVAVDNETYEYNKDLHPKNNGLPFCHTFCWRDESTQDLELVYFHTHGKSAQNIHILRPFWKDKSILKVGHNVPFDFHIVANAGIIPESFNADTMVLDFLLDENRENRHNLKECAEDFLERTRYDFAEVFGSPKLRKDGRPYANGARVVPSLPEYVADTSPPEEPWDVIEDYADEEELAIKIITTRGGEVDFFPYYSRWRTLIKYATNDAWDTLSLFELYRHKMMEIPWGSSNYWQYFVEHEQEITRIISHMERLGMPLDLAKLRDGQERAQADIDRNEAKVVELAGCPLNIGSSQQLAHLIYGTKPFEVKKGKKTLFTIQGFGLPVYRETEGGQPSTKADHLKELRRRAKNIPEKAAAVLDAVTACGSISTQITTYFKGLQERQVGGRISTRINQIGTTSGRFSSSGPNLQNIPTGEKDVYGIREAFIASPGYSLIVADFSQLEYRLLAHFSQDPTLIRAFKEGLDLHSLTAYNTYDPVKEAVQSKFGGPTKEALDWVKGEFEDLRKKAKTVNFEIIYGVGYRSLASQLNISEEEAKAAIRGWERGYPYVGIWKSRVLKQAREQGYVRTLLGRYRRPNMARLRSKEHWIRGEEERTIVNSVIQGSAADVCERVMILLDRNEELRRLLYRMLNQVHDEIVGEAPTKNSERAVQVMRPIMENPFSKPLRVPLPVSIGIGPNWAEAKS